MLLITQSRIDLLETTVGVLKRPENEYNRIIRNKKSPAIARLFFIYVVIITITLLYLLQHLQLELPEQLLLQPLEQLQLSLLFQNHGDELLFSLVEQLRQLYK